MVTPLIKIENMSYKKGNKLLLNNLNWEVQQGENWVIFGLNGSGKTTLLSIIAGFNIPTSGKLEIFGETYNDNNILQLRRQIGWVSSSFFEKYFMKETVLDIVLSGKFGSFGVDYEVESEDVRWAKKILEELRLKEKVKNTFDSLSKGERQNVLLARALLSQPKLLLLDEPDNGLDIYAREHMQRTIRELADSDDLTIIYVTHYPESIQSQFDKCILLRYGKIYAQGNTKDIFTSEKLSALLQEKVTVQVGAKGCLCVELEVPSQIKTICYGRRSG